MLGDGHRLRRGKSGLQQPGQGAFKRVRAQNIRVNTVDPVPVATDFWLGRDGVASVLGGPSGKSAEQVTEEFASGT
jgi:short-subunit dehydrogenase